MIPRGAHLVGSLPLEDTESVLRKACAALGRHLVTVPDGETGVRKDWIAWQYAVLARTAGLEPIPAGDRGYLRRQLVKLAEPGGTAPTFGPLGYARVAIESFAAFERLSREGVIPNGVRFQVSLPTPLAPMTVFVDLPDRAIVEPAYEEQMLGELRAIAEHVPHERLAIQWDVAVEIGLLERVWPAHFGGEGGETPASEQLLSGVMERLLRLGRAVPRDVALGYHLCYGDFGGRPFTAPRDAATLARTAIELLRLERPIDWLHMPVPAAWAEPSCFAPLARLGEAAPRTRMYLGVIHGDGAEAARRRIELAASAMPRFGVATECGWGRRAPAVVAELLRLHAELAAPLDRTNR